ncbi:MAG TPA: acyl carrier protein [Phycisphaerales bacterium]|nr:acyl carrier protein [Phycisphaerales bacterium]
MEDNVSIKQRIRGYIKDNVLLGDGDIPDEDTSFTETGILDSTGFLGLITFVETEFGIEISDDELDPENLETLSKISAFIQRKLEEKETTRKAS